MKRANQIKNDWIGVDGKIPPTWAMYFAIYADVSISTQPAYAYNWIMLIKQE